MEQSNMFNGKWQNIEKSSFRWTFRFVAKITWNWTFDALSNVQFLIIFWLQNEKFPSKIISHSFASLTIEQITIEIKNGFRNFTRVKTQDRHGNPGKPDNTGYRAWKYISPKTWRDLMASTKITNPETINNLKTKQIWLLTFYLGYGPIS